MNFKELTHLLHRYTSQVAHCIQSSELFQIALATVFES